MQQIERVTDGYTHKELRMQQTEYVTERRICIQGTAHATN
jgi:hypothetical protein